MRNAIREYIELTEEEKKYLWDSAIFVFDTNVLLNLYRYSSKTRDIFLQALDEFKDRVWIPRQVAEEFMEDRREVISDCSKVYTDLRTKKDVFVQQCSALLRLSVADPEIHELKERIEQWINHFEEHNPREQSFSKDDILDRINVQGVENLVDLCVRSSKRLVQISTLSIGGEIETKNLTTLKENMLYFGQNVENDYVRTKFMAERVILDARLKRGLDAVILRAGNLMGRSTDGDHSAVKNGLMFFEVFSSFDLKSKTYRCHRENDHIKKDAGHVLLEFKPA